MVVTPEKFDSGYTYDEYKASMTRNRDRFDANEATAPLEASELELVRSLPRPLKVLALAEDWCGDVVQNLPILGRLAAETGNLDLRVFPRDANLELMDQFLNNGFRSIPVFAFYDDEFNEVGRFTERPASVTERRQQERREVYASRPEFGAPEDPVAALPDEVRLELTERLAASRAAGKAWEDREVVRELIGLIAPAAR